MRNLSLLSFSVWETLSIFSQIFREVLEISVEFYPFSLGAPRILMSRKYIDLDENCFL
ncbi:hypothetical protein KCTC52924_01586 [Arenibacter antarcticus]